MGGIEAFAGDLARHVRRYNNIVLAEAPATQADLHALSEILSQLATLGDKIPAASPSDDESERPRNDEALTESIRKRFPQFGYYWSVTPTPPNAGKQEVMINDALDDLCDIHRDLNDTLWHFERGDIATGLWYAKLMFGHWGRHLIDLKSYLHKQLMDW